MPEKSDRADLPPLLAAFGRGSAGHVLYKAYPPHRGDDVPALLHLARLLPAETSFVPIRPKIDTVDDLRHVLPVLLADAETWRALLQGEPPRWEHHFPSERRVQLEELLLSVLGEVGDWMDLAHTPSEILDALRTRQPILVTAMLSMLASNLPFMPVAAAGAPLNSDARSERAHALLRRMQRIPSEGPVCIVGRPDYFFGYDFVTATHERTDFQHLLAGVGYPNRFRYVEDSAYAGREEAGIYDRKTARVYSRPRRQRGVDDYGFIFIGRSDDGRIVVVATGLSSLGTYAAVQLLQQRRADFIEAACALAETRGRFCVDIGFWCQQRHLNDDRPFAHVTAAEHLEIALLNPNDFLGYSWNRRAHDHFQDLLSAWDARRAAATEIVENWGAPNARRLLRWAWQPVRAPGSKELRVLDVTIDAPAYRITESQHLLPGAMMGKLVEQVIADVQTDRQNWCEQLLAERSVLDGSQYRRETFLPILVIGPTGSGKQWLAELIAIVWNGVSLEEEQGQWLAERGQRARDPNLLLDRGFHEVQAKLETFLEGRRAPRHAGMHVFNTPGERGELLASHLFGMADRMATEVGAKPGAFLLAGTGVLLLDELLELDLVAQTQLLLALQNGTVQPVGAGRAYRFACRVTAATNRAAHKHELEKLVQSGVLRRDLLRRFLRVYEVPALEDRPIEVIPILMSLLARRFKLNADPLYFRISAPAFEHLVTRRFTENIGEIARLTSGLPRAVIGSKQEQDPARIAECAVRLTDLDALLGDGLAASAQGGEMHGFQHRRLSEREFYQFALHQVRIQPFDGVNQAESIQLGGTASIAVVVSDLADLILCSSAELRAMKAYVESWPPIEESDPENQLIASEPFLALLGQIRSRLDTLHVKHGASSSLAAALRELWRSRPSIQQGMPLASYVDRCYATDGSGRDVATSRGREWLKSWEVALIRQRSTPPTQGPRAGRPPHVHAPVLLGFLSGRAPLADR